MFNLQLGIPKIDEQFLCNNQPLRKFFEKNFINDSPFPIELHCLTDYFHPIPGRYRCKHLILLMSESGIPILAITACEYSNPINTNDRSLYIQYIDNSGLLQSNDSRRNSLTKNCIWNLLDFALYDGISSIHLFSSSQPSLLFMDSNLNKGKTVLPPIVLANWWISIIEAWRKEGSGSSQPYAFDPSINNLFPTFTNHIKGMIREFGWREGVLSSNSNTTSLSYTPPLYEGDPKLRHWEALSSKKGKEPRIDKRGFFETMSYRVEFRECPSLFIGILNTHSSPLNEMVEVDFDLASHNRVTNFILKQLREMSFSPDQFQKESLRLSSWLKIVGAFPLKILSSTNSLLEERKEKFKEIFSEMNNFKHLEMSQINVSGERNLKRIYTVDLDERSLNNVQSLCKKKAMN